MNVQIQIKNLTEISKSQWQPLWELYLEFYKSQVADAVTERTWQRLHAAECEHMYGFAAVIEHQVVGIVHVIEHESCWTLHPYAYLQDLYTLEEYRGQGIGKALIAKVKEYCDQRQCDRVYWLTHQDNETAQKLYDQIARKTGFIQYRCH
nr:GNAT family N-acetyltransferase [Acinetobacter sp. YH12027]